MLTLVTNIFTYSNQKQKAFQEIFSLENQLQKKNLSEQFVKKKGGMRLDLLTDCNRNC